MPKMDKKMYLPNYKDGSIVNLMSSIGKNFSWKSKYKPLKGFDLGLLKKKNVIFLIIDGMGYEYLKKHGKGSFLEKNLKQKITSVFPATTACAVTTLSTGLAPREHGLTGWYMNLKEIKKVTAVIIMQVRGENKSRKINKKQAKSIYNYQSFFEKIKVKSYFIMHYDYIDSKYTNSISNKATKIGYNDLRGFASQIKETVKNDQDRKFIHAYWPELDYYGHKYGPYGEVSEKHFIKLDKEIKLLAKSLKGSDAVIIITADHGFIERKDEKKPVILNNYPKIYETLEVPLSGDTRTVYCYVKSQKRKQFEECVKKELKNVCKLRKSQDLVKENYFGLFKGGKNFFSRTGDYTLLVKDNYIIKDRIPGEKMNIYIGNHGGTSKEEMFVPLIVIEP